MPCTSPDRYRYRRYRRTPRLSFGIRRGTQAGVLIVALLSAVACETSAGDEASAEFVIRDAPVAGHSPSQTPCWPAARSAHWKPPTASFVDWSADGGDVFFSRAAAVYAVAAGDRRLRRVASAGTEVSPDVNTGREAPFEVAPDGARVVYATCEYPAGRGGTAAGCMGLPTRFGGRESQWRTAPAAHGEHSL